MLVLAAVVAALILDRARADVVALTGAAALLISGAVRPIEVQGAFASPAIIALASLFVIAYAMELSGLLDAAIRRGVALCQRIGAAGLWLLIGLCGAASAFLNNTPIVVLGAPVVRDVATRSGLSPKRYLMPLSYLAVLGGCCTLIGTSTNLLVNDMAAVAGQPRFGIFEITPVGVCVAMVGRALSVLFAAAAADRGAAEGRRRARARYRAEPEFHHAELGTTEMFVTGHALKPWKALAAIAVFVAAIAARRARHRADRGVGVRRRGAADRAPGDQRRRGLSGAAARHPDPHRRDGRARHRDGGERACQRGDASDGRLARRRPAAAGADPPLRRDPVPDRAPVERHRRGADHADCGRAGRGLGVSPRPFLVAVMMAGSAAFATPFGYQTNVIVYQMGGYSYMDFVRVGLPLNLITWATAMVAIPYFFPF